jgi:Rrf2 family cysteine metabolism transcriptional repressor
MRISTKGRYGLRAVLDLAYYSKDENIPLNTIAKRQQVSEKYMEQLFSALKKSGLVVSSMGVQGGYKLSCSPEKITVGDVLIALEGDLSIIDEVHIGTGDGLRESIIDEYLHNTLWEKINEEVYNLLINTTLQDLLDKYAAKMWTDSNQLDNNQKDNN